MDRVNLRTFKASVSKMILVLVIARAAALASIHNASPESSLAFHAEIMLLICPQATAAKLTLEGLISYACIKINFGKARR